MAATSVTGESIDIVGTVEATLHLGSTTRKHQFMVARNVTPPAILGWDFFCANDASLSTSSFSMPGITIPLVSKHQHQAPLKCNVSLVGKAVIPPLCETHVHGILSPTQADLIRTAYDGLFDPDLPQHVEIASARCLARPQDGLILV